MCNVKSFSRLFCFSALLLSVFAGSALCEEISIEIDISPSTLNLAYQGQVVTIHTNIAYSLVAGATVTLNGLPIDWWKSDDRGNFVAKFNVDAVKDIVHPGSATLTLAGNTKDGDSFSGTSTIRVVDVSGGKN
jgi:hypothetical protein